jgi:hypothetical protein
VSTTSARRTRDPRPRRGRRLRRLVLAAGAGWWLVRLAGRSGVSDADVARALPGDDLLRDAPWAVDRAAILDATPDRVWPWLVQLGKQRGGWYLPGWLEAWLPAGWRGARDLLPSFGSIVAGDVIPDYGPAPAYFQAVAVDAPHALVYVSFRGPITLQDWPPVGTIRDDVLALTWALVLEPVGATRSRLHIRLRANRPRSGSLAAWPIRIAGGLVDWLTIALLFPGLNERVRAPASEGAG